MLRMFRSFAVDIDMLAYTKLNPRLPWFCSSIHGYASRINTFHEGFFSNGLLLAIETAHRWP
jgi:hypothetical protein